MPLAAEPGCLRLRALMKAMASAVASSEAKLCTRRTRGERWYRAEGLLGTSFLRSARAMSALMGSPAKYSTCGVWVSSSLHGAWQGGSRATRRRHVPE